MVHRMLFRGASAIALAMTIGFFLVGVTPTRASACFACYPGGLGSPQICASGEHFDRGGGSAYFDGTMHDDCAPNENCGDVHDSCISLDVAGLERAVRLENVETIRWYLWSTTRLSIDRRRATIDIFDCNGKTTKQIRISPSLLTNVIS